MLGDGIMARCGVIVVVVVVVVVVVLGAYQRCVGLKPASAVCPMTSALHQNLQDLPISSCCVTKCLILS